MGTWHVVSGAAAAALLLSGCGGGAGDPSLAADSSKSANDSVSAPAFDKVAAAARAKTALFKIGDFPTGWSASEPEPESEDDDEIGQQIAKCLDAPADLFDDDDTNSGSAESPDFNAPDEKVTVASSVVVAVPGMMRQFFDVMRSDKVGPCLTEAMDSVIKNVLKEDGDEMPEGAKIDKPKVGQLSFPTFGDESVPLRVSMAVSYMGLSFDFYLDMLYIRAGDNGAYVTFEGMGSPAPIELEQKYAQLAAERLAVLSTSSPS